MRLHGLFFVLFVAQFVWMNENELGSRDLVLFLLTDITHHFIIALLFFSLRNEVRRLEKNLVQQN